MPLAVTGKGPGIDLFRKVEQALGWKQVIAEDLGYVTDSVRQLVHDSGFPGMKVLEFAFDSREESDYLPHNYTTNCVVYTGKLMTIIQSAAGMRRWMRRTDSFL